MTDWHENWGIVLAGVGRSRYLAEMDALIDSLSLNQRVVILPSVSYSLWYDCLYSADLGIALYEPGNINHVSMAGAGNKLNLYLKAGIPSIVTDTPDFVAFLKKYRAGKAVNPTDARAISRAINEALGDEREYADLCQNARRAFESEYNFETQFAPVLDWIEKRR